MINKKSINYNAELDMNDLQIKKRLDIIGKNARKIKEDTRKFLSPVTQEQINAYRKKLNVPFVVDGVKYKYSQAGDAPDLENYIPIHNVYDANQIGQLREDLKDIAKDINDLNNIITKSDRDKIEIKNAIGELNDKKNQLRKEGFFSKSPEIKKIDKEITAIKTFQKTLDENLINYKNDLKKKEMDYNYLNQEIRNNDRKALENQAEEERIKKINREKIEVWKNKLKALNTGVFNVEQFQGETEEDYLKRIGDLAGTPFDEARLLEEAELENIKDMQKNLKEIIRDDTIINNVVKHYDSKTNDRFQINKIWKILKEKFLKIYGFDNKNVSEDDITEFLNDRLYYHKFGVEKVSGSEDNENKKVSEGLPQSFLKEQKEEEQEQAEQEDNNEYENNEQEEEENNEDEDDNNNFGFGEYGREEDEEEEEQQGGFEEAKEEEEKQGEIKFDYNDNDDSNTISIQKKKILKNGGTVSNKIYLKFGDDSRTYVRQKQKIMASLTGDENSFYVLDFKLTINSPEKNNYKNPYFYFVKYLQLTKEEIKNILGGALTFLNVKALLSTTKAERQLKRVPVPGSVSETAWGWGISNKEKIPKGLVNFGKVKINLDKLYYDNNLIVKFNNGLSILGFPNVPNISDAFVQIIVKLIKNKDLTKSDFKQLPTNEQNILNELIYLGGFHKNYFNTSENQINELKKRLELIEGEIEAGNNNKELLPELQKILYKLSFLKVITKGQAHNHYKQIKKDFF